MTLKQMQKRAHDTAKAKGWWEKEQDIDGDVIAAVVDIPKALCLIHSEVSEGLESCRRDEAHMWFRDDGKPEGLASELADVVVRCMDLCGALGIDLESAILTKMSFNDLRSHKHGGKKF